MPNADVVINVAWAFVIGICLISGILMLFSYSILKLAVTGKSAFARKSTDSADVRAIRG
jgi:hypothetical protein